MPFTASKPIADSFAPGVPHAAPQPAAGARTLLSDHLAGVGAAGVVGPAEQRVLDNFARFDAEVRRAEALYAKGDLHGAALAVTLASHLPVKRHAGIFWSPRLERILVDIGRRLPLSPPRTRPASGKDVRRVLHVGTQLSGVGGLTRMIARWIKADPQRVNSVALTQQRGVIPGFFADAVKASGGGLHVLSRRPGNFLSWAQDLRKLAEDFDLVVLHIHCEDVIPIIAFADPQTSPLVVFLNHADHLFWMGPGISQVVFNLREAAEDISRDRRGIAPERNVLVPTIIDPIVRRHGREEAKRLIGESPDTTLLVSVARGAKYKTMNGVSFADLHVDLLQRHPRAKLLVVGAGTPADWEAAKAATGGRIVSLPETSDPSLYFEAADIYVDSYPFVSSTSMMEAAGYGCPLVTIFVAPDAARIFAINHPGLIAPSHVARSHADYCAALSRLIEDPARREELGRSGGRDVQRLHVAPDWTAYLEQGYETAARLPLLDNVGWLHGLPPERPSLGEPDRRHEDIVGSDEDHDAVLAIYAGMMPFRHRVRILRTLMRRGKIKSPAQAVRRLLPTWLLRVLKDR